jgi:hypothetical protein
METIQLHCRETMAASAPKAPSTNPSFSCRETMEASVPMTPWKLMRAWRGGEGKEMEMADYRSEREIGRRMLVLVVEMVVVIVLGEARHEARGDGGEQTSIAAEPCSASHRPEAAR